MEQEWNQKPSLLGHFIHVTDSFYCLLTPSIVGTFIYSDILSDSRLGSDDWTRRTMRFCPWKGHSLVWIHTDVMWQPWVGGGTLLLASFPTMTPSNLSQPRLTITMRDSIYSTSLCTHGPFPWHALERDTHAHTHVYPRESERHEHARTVEKIKMALPSICGMTSAGGGGWEGREVAGLGGWG